MLEEQTFHVKLHDRADFCCGVPALDDYLRRFAAQQSAKGMACVYVLVDDLHPRQILGFYTLSAAQVDAQRLSETDCKKLPRYRSLKPTQTYSKMIKVDQDVPSQ